MRLIAAGSLALVLVSAVPAMAHTVSGAGPSNYRTVLTSVTGAPSGVTVRIVEAGSRIELRNSTDVDVIVEGYTAEPYLRIGPGGVFTNANSPATYLNASRTGRGAVPATADPAAAPRWERTSAEPVARWHDHRIHWMGEEPPPLVQAAPDREHLISRWSIPMQSGSASLTAAGTLSWEPSPSALPWIGLATVAAAVALAIGLRGPTALAITLLGLLAVDVAHQTGIGFALAGTTGERLRSTVTGSSLAVWPLLVLASTMLLRGRLRLGLALAMLAATAVGLTGGGLEWSTLTSSQVPFAWSAASARALTAVTLGLGIGATFAAMGQARRLVDDTPADGLPTEPVPADPQNR